MKRIWPLETRKMGTLAFTAYKTQGFSPKTDKTIKLTVTFAKLLNNIWLFNFIYWEHKHNYNAFISILIPEPQLCREKQINFFPLLNTFKKQPNLKLEILQCSSKLDSQAATSGECCSLEIIQQLAALAGMLIELWQTKILHSCSL